MASSRFALPADQPSARRVYQAAASPERAGGGRTAAPTRSPWIKIKNRERARRGIRAVKPITAPRSGRHAAADGVRVLGPREKDCRADLARRTRTVANRPHLAKRRVAGRARARGTRPAGGDAAAPGGTIHRDALADTPRWAVSAARRIGTRLTGRRRGAATRPEHGVHQYAGVTSTARPKAEDLRVELAGYGGRGRGGGGRGGRGRGARRERRVRTGAECLAADLA